MTSLDFLYYSIGIAVWVFIGMSIVVGIVIVKFFTSLQETLKIASQAAVSVQLVRSGLRLGIFNFITRLLDKISK